MKRVTISFALSLLAVLACAQDAQTLYSAVSGSVVYLQHEIQLNSSDCRNPDLWRRLEKSIKQQVLDTAMPLMSGSGFFIDSDGTIITNRHVLKIGDLQKVRQSAIEMLNEGLDKNFSSAFTADERGRMKRDFRTMISKGRYTFNAMLGTQDLGDVTILAEAGEDEPDLALIKAPGGPFRPLRLAGADAIRPELVGTEVFSFGYPLGSELDAMFQERTVTMNRGSVSAFRRAELSLQHSAAISHGNSGGPLLNSEGVVLGVNTAGLQEKEGNSLFYAIDAAKVIGFLNKKGFSNIVLWNQRLPGIAGALPGQKLNALGEIECSADVILDIGKDVAVLFDNVDMGSGPRFLHLVKPVTSLVLHGPAGDFSASLRLLSTLSGSTALKPVLAPQAIPVTFESNPGGARITADGKDLGTTPLKVTLTGGTYAIRLRQEGQWYEDTTIEARPGGTTLFSFGGRKTYPVTLEGLPPNAGTTLHFESKLGKISCASGDSVRLPAAEWILTVEGSPAFAGLALPVVIQDGPLSLNVAYPVTFKDLPAEASTILSFESKLAKVSYKANEQVTLPPGSWNLSIEGNEAFSGVTVPVQVGQEPVALDLAPLKKQAALRILGFDSGARLWIDDKPRPDQRTDTVQLPVGPHTVYVWGNGLQPLEKLDVFVHVDNSSSITWKRSPGHDFNSSLLGWGGLGVGGLGSLLLGLGLYGSQNSVALSQTNSYQEYAAFRTVSNVELVSGGIMIIGAVLAELMALDEKSRYEAQKKYMNSLESAAR